MYEEMASDHQGAVPAWDGHPRSWRRYTKEVSWFVAATPTSKRRYVASKLIGKLTGSARLLAMSWNRAEFDNDNGTLLLLRKLAASPLVRRTLPNTAAIMQQYLGFKRRGGESMANFLVRETLGYEEFSEALVRLWEEQSGITPEEMTFGLPEVSRDDGWDGWKRWYYDDWSWQDWGQQDPQEETGNAEEPEAREGDGEQATPARASMGSSPSAPRDGREPDVRGRLVQAEASSGLSELSLADSFIMQVLRGWRLLQAASLSPEETRDILSSTQQQLTFEAISGALQSLWDEQLLGQRYQPWRGNGMSLNWVDNGHEWEDDTWSWREADQSEDYYGYYQDWSGWDDEHWHAENAEETLEEDEQLKECRPRKPPSKWPWRLSALGPRHSE